MIGAIIGDIVGCPYEFAPIKNKDFDPLFKEDAFYTDDTLMTLAIAAALTDHVADSSRDLSWRATYYMRKLGRKYGERGFGAMFEQWVKSDRPKPYNSFGNGSAMRVSAVAQVAKSLDDVIELSRAVTEVTHNHPEGIKGAEATAVACWMAKEGKTKEEIRNFINANYYTLDFTLDEIRPKYRFNETCQKSVPQALMCFFESESFEDAIRLAVSLGGDADTQAAIAGSVAGYFYGVPKELRDKALTYLEPSLVDIIKRFERVCR